MGKILAEAMPESWRADEALADETTESLEGVYARMVEVFEMPENEVDELLDEFCTSSLVRVVELEEILVTQHVISRAEFDTIFRHLHSLAGNSAMMALDSLSEVATELEHRITRNKKALTRENLGVAEADWATFVKTLAQIRAGILGWHNFLQAKNH